MKPTKAELETSVRELGNAANVAHMALSDHLGGRNHVKWFYASDFSSGESVPLKLAVSRELNPCGGIYVLLSNDIPSVGYFEDACARVIPRRETESERVLSDLFSEARNYVRWLQDLHFAKGAAKAV